MRDRALDKEIGALDIQCHGAIEALFACVGEIFHGEHASAGN